MYIRKSIAIPSPRENVAIMNTRTAYVSATGSELLQEYPELVASDTFGGVFRRKSLDNGKTWSPAENVYTPQETTTGVKREGESSLLFHAGTNRIFRFLNDHVYPSGVHSKDVMRLTRIYYQQSDDKGKTFGEPQQLIVDGFSPENWAPDTTFGENCIAISFCNPFEDHNGRIILPGHWIPTLDQAHPKFYQVLPMQAVCFIGTCEKDGKVRWSMGERISISPELSSRGLCEPTIAELKDGRFLAICRGSNILLEDVPGRKWIAVSETGGKTWGKVSELAFDDGEFILSPATGSQLIRHCRSGDLYWIGNIVNCRTDGNKPRHPLCIAKIDEKDCRLIRSSMAIIDNKEAGDTDSLQLSNFRTYVDRETGEFVLTMARIFEKGCTQLTSPAYEYRIAVNSVS